MKTRQAMHYFVIALCLWLPLQAMAGQWLHCAQLQTNLEQKPHLDSLAKPVIQPAVTPSKIPPCHQSDGGDWLSKDLQAAQGTLQIEAPASCKHCQFICHWHCLLMIESPVWFGIDPISFYIPFKNPSAPQPLLEQPQRPPQSFFA